MRDQDNADINHSQNAPALVSANTTDVRLGSCTDSTWDPLQSPTVHCNGKGPCRESRLGFLVVDLDGWTLMAEVRTSLTPALTHEPV